MGQAGTWLARDARRIAKKLIRWSFVAAALWAALWTASWAASWWFLRPFDVPCHAIDFEDKTFACEVLLASTSTQSTWKYLSVEAASESSPGVSIRPTRVFSVAMNDKGAVQTFEYHTQNGRIYLPQPETPDGFSIVRIVVALPTRADEVEVEVPMTK